MRPGHSTVMGMRPGHSAIMQGGWKISRTLNISWLIFVCYLLQEREDELREQMRKLREMSVMSYQAVSTLIPRFLFLRREPGDEASS